MTRKQFPDGIPAYGTDALRFTYCSLASNTRTVRFDLQRVEGYRNFCNKLWNAARFVLMCTSEETLEFDDGAFQYSMADRWIMSRLQRTTELCHHYLTTYRFDLLAQTLYEFVWHEFCDWYLELSKAVLYDEQSLSPLKRGTRRTLVHVLDHLLKLLHPIIPFITETIWQRVSKLTSENSDSIMLCAYPTVDSSLIDETIENEFSWLQKVIQSIRTIRSEMSIAPSKLIPVLVRHANDDIKNRLERYDRLLTTLGKIESIECLNSDDTVPVSATAVVGELELLIPMAGLINKEAELQRLNKELAKLDKDIEFANSKLANSTFTANAPQAIIQAMEEKLQQATLVKSKLMEHYNKIESL